MSIFLSKKITKLRYPVQYLSF